MKLTDAQRELLLSTRDHSKPDPDVDEGDILEDGSTWWMYGAPVAVECIECEEGIAPCDCSDGFTGTCAHPCDNCRDGLVISDPDALTRLAEWWLADE